MGSALADIASSFSSAELWRALIVAICLLFAYGLLRLYVLYRFGGWAKPIRKELLLYKEYLAVEKPNEEIAASLLRRIENEITRAVENARLIDKAAESLMLTLAASAAVFVLVLKDTLLAESAASALSALPHTLTGAILLLSITLSLDIAKMKIAERFRRKPPGKRVWAASKIGRFLRDKPPSSPPSDEA